VGLAKFDKIQDFNAYSNLSSTQTEALPDASGGSLITMAKTELSYPKNVGASPDFSGHFYLYIQTW
jgi:hypothetical protein